MGENPWAMSSPAEPLEDLLRRVPFFRTLDRVEIARLVGALEPTRFAADTLIFPEGGPADALYLLDRGQVKITLKTADGQRSIAVLESPAHFGDLGLLLDRRTASAYAVTDVQAWTLPRHRFEQLAREHTPLGLAVAKSLAQLVEERTRQHAGAPAAPRPEPAAIPAVAHAARSRTWRLWGGALAVAAPLALWFTRPPSGLTEQGWHVGVIMLGAAVAWLFEPVPDFVVALAMAAAWGLTGLVPVTLAFAGFANPAWVLALGAVGLAAAMARCGLIFRIALLLMQVFPRTHTGQVLALLSGGVVVTPLVPMAAARIATTAFLAQELSQSLGYPARSRASAALAFAALVGYTSFSSIFLTGLATNFFVLGLLPPADRARTSWLVWLGSAAPVGVLMFLGALAALLVLFRPEVSRGITAETLRRQRQILGPLSRLELVTLAAIAVLLAGLVLPSSLRINTAWLGIVALVVVLVAGVLDRATFRTSLEWGFLVLFGLLVGSGEVFRSVGLDRWIGDRLIPLVHATRDPGIVVVLLGACVAACRLVLPRVPTNFLLSLALVPAASQLRLSPWVVGFVVLTVGNTWLLPSLSDFNILLRDATRGQLFTERHSMAAGAAITLVTLGAIAAAVPVWRAIGLLSR